MISEEDVSGNAAPAVLEDFWALKAAWAARVRRMRRLSWQEGRVAWALGDHFGLKHGISYASRRLIGDEAGGIDAAEVSRALARLEDLDLIRRVDDATVGVAMRSDEIRLRGRPPVGYRMVLGREVRINPDLANVVAQRFEPDDPTARPARPNRGRRGPTFVVHEGGFCGDSAHPKKEEGTGGYRPSVPHPLPIESSSESLVPGRAPEGAPERGEAQVTIEELFADLLRVWHGPVGDRDEALAGLEAALDRGVFGETILGDAAAHEDDGTSCEDWLYARYVPLADEADIPF